MLGNSIFKYNIGNKVNKKNTSLKFYCTDTAKTDLSDFENASLLCAFWSSKKTSCLYITPI